MIIGTAGHIDHGKTALVKALTGVDTDRLPEEKERGITIDIGFAHSQIGGHDVSFIDVPGHERFVKNMLAGVGGIDLLMLVVAADESVMPQTREHFDICRLLQIQSGVIVITKKDLVDAEALAIARQETAELLRGSFLENAPVYEVSSKTGEGIDELRLGLGEQLGKVRQKASTGILRLPIDRVFTLKGHGTIVTGTMISGSMRRDTPAQILPSGTKMKIRSIHAHDKSVEEAVAGQRTAVNLQGIEKTQIKRGDILTEQDFFGTTSLLDVKITMLESAAPLAHNAILRFHHLTNDLLARVTLLGKEALQPGESAYAQLRLQRPVFALYGDRFILRRHSPLVTAAGGVILDHMPAKRVSRSDAAAAARLAALDAAGRSERLTLAVEQRSFLGADEAYLKAKVALRPAELRQLESRQVVRLRESPLLVISSAAAEKVTAALVDAVAEFHRRNPLLPGVPKEQLRSRFAGKLPAELFAALLDRALAEKKLQAQRETVSLSGRRVALSDQEGSLASRAAGLFDSFGLEFPGIEEMASRLKDNPAAVRSILYVLLREGKIVKIADDYFVSKSQWEELKTTVRGLKSTHRTFGVPDFKARFGVTRKYAIPLLEQLDREGITRRSGNERIIL